MSWIHKMLKEDATNGTIFNQQIQFDWVNVPQRATIDFEGDNMVVTDTGTTTKITINNVYRHFLFH